MELYDEENGTFIYFKEQCLNLEHSLVSLSKWESKWHKPFLTNGEKSTAETIDYIRCMTITQSVNDDTYRCITNENVNQVRKYIDDPMTATTFSNEKKTQNREIITAEIIYYWMVKFNIPFECQKWHLNRLLTLINVCSIKDTPKKKMPRSEIARRNSEINASRKKSMNTRG
jgi:hypothetical protein